MFLASPIAAVSPLHAALFMASGLYRGIWRFASVPDLKRIVLAAVLAAAAIALLLVLRRFDTTDSNLSYVPARLEDGRVIPGHAAPP